MKTPSIHGFSTPSPKPGKKSSGSDGLKEKNRCVNSRTKTKPSQDTKVVEMPHQEIRSERFVKSENQDIYLHDSVRFKKDVPGTQFKAGMIGGVVEACGTPARSVEVEIDRFPMYIEHVSVDCLEKID